MRLNIFSRSDLNYTLRKLVKRPGLAILSILVMAGGLSVSITAFTFNYTMFFKPLPIVNGDSIYHVCAGEKRFGCRPFRAFEFAQLRDQISVLDNVGAYQGVFTSLEFDQMIFQPDIVRTEWNMFQLSETNALLGRTLQPADHDPGAQPVAVLGYDFWQSAFNGEDDVLGAVVSIDQTATRIVGVMPPGYLFPWATEVWIPMTPELLDPVVNERVQISTFGTLRPEVSVAQADAEIAALMAVMRERFPREDEDRESSCDNDGQLQCDTGHIAELPMGQFGGFIAGILIAMTSMLTLFIFLLTCINVGTMLLARTNERLRDVSIRVALGAPRFRLLLQMMAESLIISLIGAILGILLAGLIMELLNLLFRSIDRGLMAFWQQFSIDGSSVIAALLFALIASTVTSGIPSWRIINGRFNAVMQNGTRGAVGIRAGRFSRSLIVLSIMLITILVTLVSIGGSIGLKIKGTIMTVSEANGTPHAQPLLDLESINMDTRMQTYRALHDHLVSQPAIAGVRIFASLGERIVESEEMLAGTFMADITQRPTPVVTGLTGTPLDNELSLAEGEFFDGFQDSARTAVISQSLADLLWPGESALGKRLRFSTSNAEAGPWREVIGTVNDRPVGADLIVPNTLVAYVPVSQVGNENAWVYVTPVGESPDAMQRAGSALRGSIESVVPDAEYIYHSPHALNPMTRAFDLGISLAAACALFSFLVAIVGIFGLTQNNIQLATQEIGTRRALGATDSAIRRRYMWQAGKQVLIGLLLALLITFPIVYIGTFALGTEFLKITGLPLLSLVGILVATVLLAIASPIRKILKLEPGESLRYE